VKVIAILQVLDTAVLPLRCAPPVLVAAVARLPRTMDVAAGYIDRTGHCATCSKVICGVLCGAAVCPERGFAVSALVTVSRYIYVAAGDIDGIGK